LINRSGGRRNSPRNLHGGSINSVVCPATESSTEDVLQNTPCSWRVRVDKARNELVGYHPFHEARADLLRRLDRRAEAADVYRRALAFVTNATKRAYVERRMAECVG
jgi:hypothetical protein